MEADEPFLSENEKKIVILDVEPPENPRIYLRRQILGCFAILLAVILGSMVAGYSGILLPQLKADDSIIKLSQEEESWIAAMAPLQMSIGCIFSTWTMDKYGRKRSNIACAFLAIIGWGIIYFSKSLETLLIGRVICGLYVGLSGMSSTAYLAEICSTKYRGVALSLVALGIAGGVLVVHFLGTYLTWQTTALVTMVLPFIVIALLIYLPETHVWYLNCNKVEEARKSFEWFPWSQRCRTKRIQSNDGKSAGPKKSLSETLAECKKQEFYHPLMILFLFFVTTQVTGTNVVTFYSVQLMQITVPSLDRYAAMMIVDVARVVMSIVASVLTKRYRVRELLFTSSIGCVLSLFALSGFVYMGQTYPDNKVFTTVPLVFLMTYILFISIGLVPLPWTVCGEILPSTTKGIGGGTACAVNFIAFFVVVKTSPFLFDVLGTHGTFALYGVLVILGTVGLYFVLPETKNRSLQEIQDYFKPRSSKIYQSCDNANAIKQ
ncbi:LOW QUALITY PROTEIN: facilitated trehalose transporter Tret1-like [Atheta coriaria]|uniref:LOW QUALITY PROTEIN: facilitated trehalose transporter Tret1-like n=1 Tax=Dalotia coriaria TaxID=877792 RepID=UPI0031F3C1A9